MKTRVFYIALLLCWLSACNSKTSSTTSTSVTSSDSSGTAAQPVNNAISISTSSGPYYKRLEGTIAGQPVVMHLTSDGNNTSGMYYYEKQGVWLSLSAIPSTNKDSVHLYEMFAGDEAVQDGSDAPNTELKCKFSSSSELNGIWYRNGKNLPVALKEAYPTGSYQFMPYNTSDSVNLNKKANSAKATISYSLLQPAGNTAPSDEQFINKEIASILQNHTTNLSIQEVISNEKKEYFKEYLEDNNDDDTSTTEDYSMNFQNQTGLNIMYNDKGFIVFSLFNYGYQGGAHGNYASSLYIIDVQEKREWKLKDIVAADSVTWLPILARYYKIQYHMKPTDSLNTQLFENYLPANENVYITNRGLGFLYNPYEVASYAQGQVNVFIPFNAVMQYITPAFKKRFGL